MIRSGRALAAAAMISALLSLAACETTAPEMGSVDLEAALGRLGGPLPGDPAVLYRLRLPSSGGLRLAVMTHGDEGRLTVSEPFGSAVSVIAWRGAEPPTFFDLREGCRVEAADLEQVLGIAAMPLPEAVRLLSGRLPAAAGDEVTQRQDGRLLVAGRGWTALVTVASEPWRVVAVEEGGAQGAGWRLSLGDHSASVPGLVRVEKTGGRWAELELVRLEWNRGEQMPPILDLPLCVIKGHQ